MSIQGYDEIVIIINNMKRKDIDEIFEILYDEFPKLVEKTIREIRYHTSSTDITDIKIAVIHSMTHEKKFIERFRGTENKRKYGNAYDVDFT